MDSWITVSQFRPGRLVALVLATLLVLTTLAAFGSPAQAQTTVPEIDFRVLKINCPEDPGVFPEGEIPAECTPVEGVAFTIAVAGGETLTCTTNADGRCLVQVPSEAQVTVTEDTATGTDGYAPLENPIETQAVTEFAGAVFVNVPEDIDELPETGTGPARPDLTGQLVVIASLLAIVGLRLRQPHRGERSRGKDTL